MKKEMKIRKKPGIYSKRNCCDFCASIPNQSIISLKGLEDRVSTRKAFMIICACIAICLLIDLIHKIFYTAYMGRTAGEFQIALWFLVLSYLLYKEDR